MVVVQEAFDVPTDIMAKLATGEYRRIGGLSDMHPESVMGKS